MKRYRLYKPSKLNDKIYIADSYKKAGKLALKDLIKSGKMVTSFSLIDVDTLTVYNLEMAKKIYQQDGGDIDKEFIDTIEKLSAEINSITQNIIELSGKSPLENKELLNGKSQEQSFLQPSNLETIIESQKQNNISSLGTEFQNVPTESLSEYIEKKENFIHDNLYNRNIENEDLCIIM